MYAQPPLEWSSETDVCNYVKEMLTDTIYELDLPLKVRAEVDFFSLRPDITLVKRLGIPVGVVEVKKPAKGIMDNKQVLGELYDYMEQVENFYGLEQVFGILTTYEEWRVCWSNTEKSRSLASAPCELSEDEHTPRTPSPQKRKGPSIPPDLTPSKKQHKENTFRLPGGEDAEQNADDDGEPEPAVEDERRMCSTRVWRVDENVFPLVGAALCKMAKASESAGEIGAAQKVVQVTPDSFYWCNRPEVARFEKLKWDMVPGERTKNLLLLWSNF